MQIGPTARGHYVSYAPTSDQTRYGILSVDERLMRLVIAIESAATSAQIMIVTLNQFKMTPIAAASLSYMYVFQYITSIFTITFWVTMSMASVYSSIGS